MGSVGEAAAGVSVTTGASALTEGWGFGSFICCDDWEGRHVQACDRHLHPCHETFPWARWCRILWWTRVSAALMLRRLLWVWAINGTWSMAMSNDAGRYVPKNNTRNTSGFAIKWPASLLPPILVLFFLCPPPRRHPPRRKNQVRLNSQNLFIGAHFKP